MAPRSYSVIFIEVLWEGGTKVIAGNIMGATPFRKYTSSCI